MGHDPNVSYGIAVLIIANTYVLLIQRDGAHAAGTWALPGGWVQRGELAPAACARELREELGVEVETARFETWREEYWPETDTQSLSLYFTCRLKSGAKPAIREPAKCKALQWVDLRSPETWPQPLFPNLQGVLREMAAKLD